MRFNVDRICELAGLGAASGGLISEGAAPVPAKPAPAADAKSGMKAAPPAAKKAAPAPAPVASEEDEMEEGDVYELDPGDGAHMTEDDMIDDSMTYEIDETELMEALVDMRQQRLEENQVRDAVRDEIQRALSDKSGAWMYGGNKPTASRQGQIARGGFGFGFGFKR